jgi:cell filamentation protein
MKQRVLVMNGQRVVQSEIDGGWVTSKVGKAGGLKPGIYDISAAVLARKDQTYDGVVVHADREHVYQQVGKNCVRHSAHDFQKAPDVGIHAAIKYDVERAVASQTELKNGRGVKR